MFTKKPDGGPTPLNAAMPPPTPSKPPVAGGTSRPATSVGMRSGEKLSPSIIGADLIITGNLQSKGEVQIDGTIQGDLHGTHVVVGERAKITGGIVADDVIVRGHVEGSIRGLRVTLQSSSRVEGDIYHQSLAIEQGAYFEGKSRRTEDPIAELTAIKPSATAPRASMQPVAAAPAVNGTGAPPTPVTS